MRADDCIKALVVAASASSWGQGMGIAGWCGVVCMWGGGMGVVCFH